MQEDEIEVWYNRGSLSKDIVVKHTVNFKELCRSNFVTKLIPPSPSHFKRKKKNIEIDMTFNSSCHWGNTFTTLLFLHPLKKKEK